MIVYCSSCRAQESCYGASQGLAERDVSLQAVVKTGQVGTRRTTYTHRRCRVSVLSVVHMYFCKESNDCYGNAITYTSTTMYILDVVCVVWYVTCSFDVIGCRCWPKYGLWCVF